jgi:hypothetical protein
VFPHRLSQLFFQRGDLPNQRADAFIHGVVQIDKVVRHLRSNITVPPLSRVVHDPENRRVDAAA